MIFAPPVGNSTDQIAAWARRLTDDLNRFAPPPESWPTFADDTSAAAGNLNVGQPYVTPSGELRRRVA